MEKIILKRFKESSEVKTRFLKENLPKFLDVIKLISHTFEVGNKLFFFGNGGSAADAQHLAAEFVNRHLIDRPPLPAIALTTDTSILTSISNDMAFNEIFAKQLRALGKRGDVAIGYQHQRELTQCHQGPGSGQRDGNEIRSAHRKRWRGACKGGRIGPHR